MAIQSQTTLPKDQDGRAIQVINPGATSTLATGVQSSAFLSNRVLRCISDADCYIRISKENTIASASDIPLRADSPEYFLVKTTQKLSVFGANLTYTIGAGKDEIL